MSEKAVVDYVKDDMDYVHEVVFAASRYCPGEVGWIARQMTDGKWTEDYGFVIGKAFATVTTAEARNTTDAFHRELAGRILGFPVDSRQDLERRKAEAEMWIEDYNTKLESIRKWIAGWEQRRFEIVTKLDALTD